MNDLAENQAEKRYCSMSDGPTCFQGINSGSDDSDEQIALFINKEDYFHMRDVDLVDSALDSSSIAVNL